MKTCGIAQGMRLLGTVILIMVVGAGVAFAESSQAGSPAVTGTRTNQVQSAAAGATTNNLLEIITVTSNKYERCKITKVEPSAITVFHSKGIARILFIDLPEEWQKKYNYDPDKARAYEKELAEQRQRQVKANAENMQQKPDASRTSNLESSAAKTAPKTKRAESAEDATERSKKAAKHATGRQDVPMPIIPF